MDPTWPAPTSHQAAVIAVAGALARAVTVPRRVRLWRFIRGLPARPSPIAFVPAARAVVTELSTGGLIRNDYVPGSPGPTDT